MFADDVTVIGVGGRDDADSITNWVADNGVDGFDHINDPNVLVWREYGITSQPAFVFINDDGTSELLIGGLGIEGLTDRVQGLIAG